MTVLRSREILSAPKPRNVVEPVTPQKISEIPNQSVSPDQSSGDQEIGVGVGAGSVMVSESGSVRRVSARLAKKAVENVEFVGKRKKGEETSLGCTDVTNLRGCDSDAKGSGENGIGNPGLQDLVDGGVTELVEDSEKSVGSASASSFGFGVRDTKDSGRRKRRLSMEANALGFESSEKDKLEKGFLSLRSGKRLVKRQVNDENNEESNAVSGGDVAKGSGSEEVTKGKISPVRKTDVRTKDTLTIAGKMKMEMEVQTFVGGSKRKLDDGASSSSGINTDKLEVENANGSVSGVDHSDEVRVRATNLSSSDDSDARSLHRERFKNFARRNASRFAHFSFQDEISGHAPDTAVSSVTLPESSNEIEDWPGPFSTAMKIIKDRETNRNGERRGVSTDKNETVELKWIPKSHGTCKHPKQVPSLQSICLSILSENADSITSLDFVPDALRHKICWFLCDSRRMDGHFLKLLVHGTPTEVRVRDCSWLSEELFDKIFKGCNTSKLTVLQLDQGGACIPDYTLYSALAHSPNSLPVLTTLSLKGAYRLSDAGLSMLASAAPSLQSIDISQCPLLTSEGLCCLVDPLKLKLRELYIDYCYGIDAMLILPDLQKLKNLEVLSVAGIPTVCDDFVSAFASAHGSRMKELVLADCMELTDSSLKVIGDTCSDLQAIDLTNLCKLTDISIGHLANGCQAIQTLKLCRNAFSDEAIAAYLDVSGASLKFLSLNNIIQVSNHTALSLARNCKNLRSLDLSWCRNLTNEALGMIVDSCHVLEVLKLFGCTQVTNVFLDGHSNAQVNLIGLKMTPVVNHIDVPDFLLGPLRYPSVSL